MRKAIIAAAIVALLFVLYTAAGHWLAPRFIRDTLVEQAGRLGLELRIGQVRTDPVVLSVVLENVEVLAPDGRKLAAAYRAGADLAWASLWRPAWIVEQASLTQPSVEITLGPKGEPNWRLPGKRAAGGGRAALMVENLTVNEGAVHFLDHSREEPVELTLEALHFGLTGLSTQAQAPAQYQLAAQVVAGGTISSRGRVSVAPLAAHGRLDIAAVAVSKVWELAAPGTDPGQGQLQASAAYIYEDGDLVLQEVSIEATRFAYAGIELRQVALEAPRLALPLKETFELAATADVTPAGRISARGSLGLEPFMADVQLELADLVLAEAQRWLPEEVAVNIASGALSANGNLRIAEADITYQGAAALRDVRFEEPRSGDLLLGWQLLHTQEANLRFAPFDVEIGELVAQAPQGRLIIEADGRINFAEVIRGEEGDPAGKKPFEATVGRLRLENGTLEFADRSLDNDFAVTIRDLAGAITAFSTEAGNPGRVQLGGRVEKYGSARIRGTINLDAPKSLANIRATFRNLDLAALTPYIVKFAGYRVESGRVSAELRYRVRNGRLIGQNHLVFEQMQLGEKVQSAGALDLPLELAVALLADSKGRINLDIAVSGNLNDPRFDFGGLIAKALRNVIGRIVSAPFRTLAALIGKGGTDLDRVRFEPGSVVLTPSAEENVAQVAKALGQRPQLGVTVQGGYDPESNLAALRRQAVRRDIAQRAGYEGKGPLDFSDPKVLHAAENQYLERVGNRLELQKLREAEPRYGRALVEKLAAAKPVEPGTAETLAQTRAETVRATLLEHGVHPSRVRLEAPAPEEAGKGGCPLCFP